MAIIAFTGTPGSGKTYDAVKKILDNLQLGKVVYTNIDGMNNWRCLEMIKNVCKLSDLAITRQLVFLTDDDVMDFWNHTKKESVIVLDEVQKYFNSREWQSHGNKEFAKWCSTHRHEGYELILITQDAARLDSAVRSLLEWCYVYRKVNFFGSLISNSYLCYSYSGVPYGPALTKNVYRYDRTVFFCYKSYTSADIKEQGIMQHANVLKHPVFYALPIMLFFTLYMVFGKSSFTKGDLFGAQAMLDKVPERVQDKGSPQAPDKHPLTVTTYTDPSGKIIFSNRRLDPK